MSPSITQFRNNFTIITDTMPHVESISINIWINVGSRYENTNITGISHFLEHMAFKGTKTRTALDIAQIFDDIGGNFNAHTDREHTVYHVKTLKRDIKIAIEVLADIILNSQFPQEEIDREKGVVLQEIYQTNDSPTSIIFDKYIEAAYPNQIFGKSILGTPESVTNLSKEDLQTYMSEYYHAGNMLLSVAGNITHEEVIDLVSQHFSNMKKSEPKTAAPSVYYSGEYREIRNLEQVHLVIGFPSVSYKDDLFYTIQILDSILGNGMSSRLFQKIREQLGLVYTISSFNSSYSDNGIFSIYAATDKNNLIQLLTTIASEVKSITMNLEENEITRAKGKLISEILMSRESTTARAESLGYYYSHYNRYILKEELIKKISEITLTDLQNCIHNLLGSNNKITLAAIGQIENLPSYGDIVQMFHT
ncbi:M16 family metallopeptidase [Ehrlichia canis]|uniref:Insulinase-like:Peptidase M16, C-terminal n=1 Tax=Ehrlichia canis (strain Jake) TaxID=269484 RepID=A0ACA6AWD9_EHRCJ|nr:pitrilysin family protein [Ehrlichia canis]AAZ68806.1 Insulinase-like:Peptidase M16, C-terminal [Ehrlichia canis str. Jake]AUO54465.1 insulinase family protein [Ehrlichia canis]UKC53178.1 insulinase family protein [Ehrlichia canis]UKC54115.1 insulinase family protein [Ehrlichia canis]UKC55051.1 insulinase family protein [Ehrlichia canis]